MSAFNPGGPVITIQDLVPGVQQALQNRSDVTVQLAGPWIAKTLKEFTRTLPFEELRITGPTVNTTANQYSYPVSFFVNPGDDYGLHESLNIFITNQIAYPLKYTTPRAIEPLLHIQGGIPAQWTRYGTQIFLGPPPNKIYPMFFRYQKRHPINYANIATTPVLIDETWFDIVEYAAAERGAIMLRWSEQARMLHDILYGDPEFQTSAGKLGRPGLIFSRQVQMEEDEGQNTRQLVVTVPRYQ